MIEEKSPTVGSLVDAKRAIPRARKHGRTVSSSYVVHRFTVIISAFIDNEQDSTAKEHSRIVAKQYLQSELAAHQRTQDFSNTVLSSQ
jgi:hypothetical protein